MVQRMAKFEEATTARMAKLEEENSKLKEESTMRMTKLEEESTMKMTKLEEENANLKQRLEALENMCLKENNSGSAAAAITTSIDGGQGFGASSVGGDTAPLSRVQARRYLEDPQHRVA